MENGQTGNDLPQQPAFPYKLNPMEEDQDDSLDEDFPLGDGVADMDAVVACPYCGEEVEIAVEPDEFRFQELKRTSDGFFGKLSYLLRF